MFSSLGLLRISIHHQMRYNKRQTAYSEQQNKKVLAGQKTKAMKINMTLRGSAVMEEVTASIVVTFIYPGSVSHTPCDSVCGAGLR